MTFEGAKELVELSGIFMVLMPTVVFGVLALKWHFYRKGGK